jgi:vacuolar protein sorting-associated protein 13A/C
VTQQQYHFIMRLVDSIPKVLAATSETDIESQAALLSTTQPSVPPSPLPAPVETPAIDLKPEIEPAGRIWTSVDLVLTVKSVKLHLYDGGAMMESDLKTHGVARFSLTNNCLRYKVLSDSAAEAEFVIKSFTMSNTRVGPTRFREIIPAAQHNRDQFMVLYTTSGGTNPSSLVLVTVDSPKIIFSVDPVFALLGFFSNASESGSDGASETNDNVRIAAKTGTPNSISQPTSIDFRIDLHDVTISVLESDAIAETQAIQLSVKQVLISQQVSFLLIEVLIDLTFLHLVGYPRAHGDSSWHVLAAHGQAFGWCTLSG